MVVRQAISVQPLNVANLIYVLSHHLFTLLPSSLFPTSPSSTQAPGQDPTKEALNCLRVLGRVLVVVYEGEAGDMEKDKEQKSFAERWLWNRQPVETRLEINGDWATPAGVEREGSVPVEGKEESQFMIADDEEDEPEDIEGKGVDDETRAFKSAVGHPHEIQPSEAATKVEMETTRDPLSEATPVRVHPEDAGELHREEEDTIPCLIDRLFNCTIDLLFCAGFTVPDNVRAKDGTEEKINVRLSCRDTGC